jgi:methionine-rich copper-binding protein CopC
MKRTMARLVFVVFLSLGFAAQAQSREDLKQSTPEQRAQLQTEYLKNNLHLDEQQTQKVADINLKSAQKMESVLNGSGGKLSKMKTAKNINKEKEAGYKEVLTSEQYKQYQELKEDMKEKMKERRKQKKAQ